MDTSGIWSENVSPCETFLPLIHSPPCFPRSANPRHETTTSPGVTNTKYAGEKCFAPLATPRHFLGSPASPRRITVRRNKRVAHYFYESSRISPEVSEDTLAAFFPTLLSYSSFHPSSPSSSSTAVLSFSLFSFRFTTTKVKRLFESIYAILKKEISPTLYLKNIVEK